MTFSLSAYQELLRTAKNVGRMFSQFGDALDDASLLLRHDIDYSMQMATEVARINHEEGVHGTFFLLLRSDIYNLLSEPSQAHVDRILDLDQDIGFHVAVPNGMTPDEVVAWLPEELDRFKDAVPATRQVFAWHNTTPHLLQATASNNEIAGWTNAYSDPYFTDITYRSDTNFRNSVEELHASIATPGPLQFLIHPCNWVAGGNDMRDVFTRTWSTVIREREHDFLSNREYQSMLPKGIPDDVLEQIGACWRSATEN